MIENETSLAAQNVGNDSLYIVIFCIKLIKMQFNITEELKEVFFKEPKTRILFTRPKLIM